MRLNFTYHSHITRLHFTYYFSFAENYFSLPGNRSEQPVIFLLTPGCKKH